MSALRVYRALQGEVGEQGLEQRLRLGLTQGGYLLGLVIGCRSGPLPARDLSEN